MRDRAQPLALFAIVDCERIPPRCLDESLSVAATGRRCEKAYGALCDALCRNHQVGLTTVSLDGEPRVAALLPIGGILAVTPLRREYASALAEGLCEDESQPSRRRAA
jgi:non-homologous end joining protein Ku